MADITISQLPTQTEVDESVYIPVESVTKGTRKYPIGSLISEFDTDIERLERAIDAVDDISQQAIPLMSQDTRGGAKLRQNGGLEVIDDSLGVYLTNESDGDVAGPIAALTAEGWAEQDSTTGKNLLPNNATSQTVNGVTFTVNADGSVTLNGTSSNASTFSIASNFELEAGSYVLSGCPNNGSYVTYGLQFLPENTDADYGSGYAFTLSSRTSCTSRIRIGSGVTFSNLTFYPQLELGSTATEYEPYTGGAPSPSPDYPQEIRVVRGRNLWDPTSELPYFITSSDNTVYSVASHNIYQRQHSIVLKVRKNTTYRLSGVGGSMCRVIGIVSSSVQVGDIGTILLDAAGYGSFNSGNFEYVMCWVGDATRYNAISNTQLELGSTPTPYVPYGHVGLEVTSKNKCYWKAFSNTSGRTVKMNDDGTTYANGSGNCYMVLDKPAKAGQYFCIELVSGSVDSQVISDSTIFTDGYNYRDFGTYKQFKVDAQSIWLHVNCRFDNCILKLSVTDEIPDHWIPYFESTVPIPLPSRGWVGSLPDGTADKLTLDGAGKVTWELDTNEVVVDGSESWSRQSTNNKYSYATAVNGIIGAPNNVPIISDKFIYENAISISTSRMDLTVFTNSNSGTTVKNGNISIRIDSLTTLSDFTTWLASNPVTVLYPLATPVTEEAGYVDLPDIPSDATVSIPELDALNVEYFIDNSISKLSTQQYQKVQNYDIANVEEAIADLTALFQSFKGIFEVSPAVSHRNIFRGKNLGTAITSEQKAAIANATFDDLYVGDYWTINGRVYRIADIDYYYQIGNSAFTKHHLVIVPDASFGNGPMNDTNTTEGSYVGSKMYTDSSSVLNTARTTIANDFGSMLATHRILLTNAVTNGYANGGTWYDSTVDLMSEIMVYGSNIFSNILNDTAIPYNYTAEKSQLALFRLNPSIAHSRSFNTWLRDVVSAAAFAYVASYGNAAYRTASYSFGVRPAFCIVGN